MEPDLPTEFANQLVADFTSKHGALVGKPAAVDPTIRSVSQSGQQVEEPNPNPYYLFTFTDGTTLELNKDGQIRNLKEPAPRAQVPPGWSNQFWLTNPDGSKTLWGTGPQGGAPTPVPGVPNEPAPPKTGAAAGWSGHFYVTNPDGSKTLWGTPPEGGAPRPIPNIPNEPPPKATPTGWTNPFDITNRDGTITRWGTPPEGGAPRPIPNVPTQPAPSQAHSDYTDSNGIRWTWDPNRAGGAGYVVAPGTPTRPTDFTSPRYVISADGRTKQVWGVDPSDGQLKPFPGAPLEPNTPDTANRPTTISQSTGEIYSFDPTTGKLTQLKGPTPRDVEQVTPSTTVPYIQQRDPVTGQIVNVPNLNYAPKTLADVSAMVDRLNQQARAKRDELSKLVAAQKITDTEAGTQFNAWWDQNIEPQKGQLATIQRQAATEERRKEEEATRTNLTAAQLAGKQAADIAAKQRETYVGPGWGAAVNAIMQGFANPRQPLPNIDYAAATTYRAPSLASVAEQATADYLKHISPTAAAIAGGAAPSVLQPGFDINNVLNRSSYQFTGGAPGAAPPNATVPLIGAPVPYDSSNYDLSNPWQAAVAQNQTMPADQLAQMLAAGNISSVYNLPPYQPYGNSGQVFNTYSM